MDDLRETRAMDSALATSEGEAGLLNHPDATSRLLWAEVLVARRKTDDALARNSCICPPADKGHAYGKITMGCPVHAVPVDNALFNLPGDPHQDGGGDE